MPAQQESSNYATERVTDFRSPVFDRCLLILEESIPADARLPSSRLMDLLAGNAYQLWCFRRASELGDGVAGAALLYFSTDLPFVLLDYLAIDAARRNQGLGSAFFRGLASRISTEKPGADWLILEVDDDREGSEEHRATSRRRMEFYRRLGAQLLANLPYRFPCADGDFLPMRLMVHRLRPEARLSLGGITAAIEETFLHIHARNSGDELLAWFRASRPAFLEFK